jgi:hypothetical protein
MMDLPRSFHGVPRESQALLRELGLTEMEQVFTDPRIETWRSIPERENCTLDAMLADGRTIRLHIKRHKAARNAKPPGEQEADGICILEQAKIPTMKLIAWGKMEDGRSFLITEDLAEHRPADKLIESGVPFERLLEPTADLAAKLHSAGLHHRDLYLCHFLAKLDDKTLDLRLIDAARVGQLPAWFFRQRWIVKDLAQFWYSATRLSVSTEQLEKWLQRYAQQRRLETVDTLRRAIERKMRSIARHDAKLNERQPQRNLSLPGT